MQEIWKNIKGYEGLYQVSNLGRIRSIDKIVKRGKNGDYFRKGIILKPYYSSKLKEQYPVLETAMLDNSYGYSYQKSL